MNIFVTDRDPAVAAQNLCDSHCVKMILESAQLLCTAHWFAWSRVLDPPPELRGRKLKEWISVRLDDKTRPQYSMTHVNHPCSVWARQCKGNYVWLVDHALAMCEEYTRRYKRVHKTEPVIRWASCNFPPQFSLDPDPGGLTPFAVAMPVEYRDPSDPVQSYRNYYHGSKSRIAKWKHSSPPTWWDLNSYEKRWRADETGSDRPTEST